MCSKLFLPLLCVLLLYQEKITVAEDPEFLNASPEIIRAMFQAIPLSSSLVSAFEQCKMLTGDNLRACIELYTASESDSNRLSTSLSVESCKVFTGDQFRSCIEIYMLEQARLNASPSTKICKGFTGNKYRICTEMPTPFLNTNCSTCMPEKLRLCILVYLPNSTNTTTVETGNSSTTLATTLATTTAPQTSTPIYSKPRVRTQRRNKGMSTSTLMTTSTPTTILSSTVAKVRAQRRKRGSTFAPNLVKSDCDCDHHHH